MSETSADISPGCRMGVSGGMGAGHAAFSFASALRMRSRAAASTLVSSGAAASIMRSASHTKPRLSWYSTGFTKRPPSMEVAYSLSATFSTSAAERAVKPRRGFMNFLTASSAPSSRWSTTLSACSYAPLRLAFTA